MIIVMKADVAPRSEDVKRVIATAEGFPGIHTQVFHHEGATRSLVEIHLHGPTATIPTAPFEALDAVEKVVRVTERFRAIGRHGVGEAGIESVGFEYNGVHISQETLHVFPGLCAVDTRDHVDRVFAALAEHGVVTARAGVYKPRTSPYDFQGLGAACLPWLFESAGKHGIRIIAMEITHESQLDEVRTALAASGDATGVMVQVGTRNAQNFELLKAIGAQQEFPVLFKRGFGIALEESLNAVEYVASGGNRNIVFGLRGMRSHLGDPHRNFVDFSHVPVVKRLTRLPVCVDPSHSVGRRSVDGDGILDLFTVTAQGVIAGANMVLVDFHPNPKQALCDGPQALLLEELPLFLEDVRIARRAYEARRKLLARR